MPEDHGGVTFDRLPELQANRRSVQKRRKPCPPNLDRLRPQILAVEVQQIKRDQDGVTGCPALHGVEVGKRILPQHKRLPVDQRRRDRQPGVPAL
jgi:hypothetical protein